MLEKKQNGRPSNPSGSGLTRWSAGCSRTFWLAKGVAHETPPKNSICAGGSTTYLAFYAGMATQQVFHGELMALGTGCPALGTGYLQHVAV